MTSIFLILGRAIQDFIKAFVPLLGFDILFRITTAVLLAPLSAAVLRGLVRMTGRYAVGNQELAGFLLSTPGLGVVAATGTIGLFLLFLEHAGLIVIGHEAARGRRINSFDAMLATVRRLWGILGLGLRQFAIYVLVALPFLAVVAIAYRLFWSGLDLYYLTTQKPPRFWIGAAIAAVALGIYGVLALWLTLRWLLSLPALLLDGTTPREAIRMSVARTRGHLLRNLSVMILGFLIVVVWSFVLGLGFRTAADMVLDRWSRTTVEIPLLAGLLSVQVVLGAFLSFVGTCMAALSIVEIDRSAAQRTDLMAPGLATEETRPSRVRLRLRTLLLATLALLVTLAAWTTREILVGISSPPRIEITAHRGDSTRAPENSLAAIQRAIEAHADYAEIDVQLSSDGIPVVFHDEDLRRIAGDPRRIRDLSLDELRRIDIGRHAGTDFEGERMPTLDEVIEAAGHRIKLNIELKTSSDPKDFVPLVRAVAAVIRERSFEARCIVSSLSYPALAEVRRQLQGVPVGFIVFQAIGETSRLLVDFLSVREPLATDDLIAQCRRRGITVHVWTVNDPNRLGRLMNHGVDNVITSDPAPMVVRRDELIELDPMERALLWYRESLDL